MPRGASTKPKKADPNAGRPYYATPDAVWGGYINLRITTEEREDFDSWAAQEGDGVWVSVDNMMVDGLKLTVSYDAENSCYIASFTGAGCLGDRARYALVSRGGTYGEAVALAVYKHTALLDGDWGRFTPANGRFNFG